MSEPFPIPVQNANAHFVIENGAAKLVFTQNGVAYEVALVSQAPVAKDLQEAHDSRIV